MRKALTIIGLAGIASTAGWSTAGPAASGHEIEIFNSQSKTIGTANLREAAEGGVEISLDLRDLKPGEHGIHITRPAAATRPRSRRPAATSTPRAASTAPQIRRGHTRAICRTWW